MKHLNTLKLVGEICEEIAMFNRVMADVYRVQATAINLLSVKLVDHFLCYRITRAAPGRTPNTALLLRCTYAAY